MNAVALGLLAVLVGWTDTKIRSLFRARAYLHFLEDVDDPTPLSAIFWLCYPNTPIRRSSAHQQSTTCPIHSDRRSRLIYPEWQAGLVLPPRETTQV
jgi:hypothetical protein